jgi:transposase-like protein
MDAVTKSRLNWVKLFLESNDAGYVCRRCGISRPTLRKWVKRYEDNGLKGLEDKIRRPHSSPGIKITDLATLFRTDF